MIIDSKVINTLLAATLLLGWFGLQNVARADTPANMEKCYGIAKAGMNDCDNSNDASGCDKSVIDADPNYFIFVPKGLCNKIVGGLTNIGPKSIGAPAVNIPPVQGTSTNSSSPQVTATPTAGSSMPGPGVVPSDFGTPSATVPGSTTPPGAGN